MAINYNELQQELSSMSERSILFKIVKAEMVKRGHWKLLKRGFHVTKWAAAASTKRLQIVPSIVSIRTATSPVIYVNKCPAETNRQVPELRDHRIIQDKRPRAPLIYDLRSVIWGYAKRIMFGCSMATAALKRLSAHLLRGWYLPIELSLLW